MLALIIVFLATALIAACLFGEDGARRALDRRLDDFVRRRRRRGGEGAALAAAGEGAADAGEAAAGAGGAGAGGAGAGGATGGRMRLAWPRFSWTQAKGRAGAGEKRRAMGFLRALDRRLETRRFGGGLALRLRRADLRLRVGEFLAFSVSAGVILGIVALWSLGPLAALGLFCAGVAVPFLYVGRRCEARVRAFGGQLPDALLIMANCLRSGYSVLQAMDVVGRELPPPIGRDFDRVVREVRVNIPIEDAMKNLVHRINSPDLDLVVTAILIQRQVGGNLAEVLDRITWTIRERVRIQGEIRTLTAQGRISGWIIAFLPAALGCLLYLMSPEYIGPLVTTPAGWAMVGLAVFMELVGVFFISRVIKVEV
jgi:tight adherence protein B